MGCGLVSQRAPSVEVHHPITLNPGHRAAGARLGEHGGDVRTGLNSAASEGGAHPQGEVLAAGADGRTAVAASASGGARTTDEGRAAQGGPGRATAGRRFIMGERVVLPSRLPLHAQDHAFCFECGSFFQLGGAGTSPSCSRCGSNFVQFLRPPGSEHWIRADSNTGASYAFDDQLESTLNTSMDETPTTKRPVQAAFLRGLPSLQLTEAEVQARKMLDARDPKCHCAICRESFCVVYTVKRLPCSHEFHTSCIVPWLQSNSSCPICRFRLPEATEGEEVEEEDEGLQCLKRPASDCRTEAAVVGVPTSSATESDGMVADGMVAATGSEDNGSQVGSSTAVVRCPEPQAIGTETRELDF